MPDWPTTFGYNMFLFPISEWIGGIFFEHVHRLIASTVGFLTIILSVWLWRSESRRWVRILGYAALAAVILQGILGGLRVTMLKDEIGIFHACLAQAYLGLLIVLALVTSPFWNRLSSSRVAGQSARLLATISVATSIIIYAQLALGATMRHQHRDLSILDFPLAYGKVIPEVNAQKLAAINAWRDAQALSDVTAFQIWLQMAHRFVAVIIATCIVTFWFYVRRCTRDSLVLKRLSSFWVLFVACQITLGAWTIWSNKAADVATAHVAIGAIIFGLGITLAAICLRLADQKIPAASNYLSLVREQAASL